MGEGSRARSPDDDQCETCGAHACIVSSECERIDALIVKVVCEECGMLDERIA